MNFNDLTIGGKVDDLVGDLVNRGYALTTLSDNDLKEIEDIAIRLANVVREELIIRKMKDQ